MRSEWNELHRSSLAGCFRTRVNRQGSGGVGGEGSASDFLVGVAGRSGITDTGLEPTGDADSGAGTTGAGTGVEAVGTCLLVLSVFKKKVPQCLNHTMSWCLIVHNTLLIDFVINSIVMTTDSKPASHRCSGNPGLQGQHT